jgi:hypothetical protein
MYKRPISFAHSRTFGFKIYDKYKNGETIYLECYCHPLPCHGDVIVKKIQKRLLREKIKEAKEKRNDKQRQMAEVL